ncbi:MAG: HAMP domain-containing protein [Deltaproteobacteria bacterium]|nr:HAMP domain-containing protein [Deltaproteobacteria bacterium]
MAVAVGLGCILANKVMNPVHQLIKASKQVSEGSLTPDIGPISKDQEMRVLQDTFKDMVGSMARRRKTGQRWKARSRCCSRDK